MLNNEICTSSLFTELSPFAQELGLVLVDVQKHVHGPSDVQIACVVNNPSGDTTIENCEKFHRSIQSRLELMFGRDELSMEVSTPGLQRNFRDVYEFSVFCGKLCRVYDLSRKSWIEGTICSSDTVSVELENYTIEDSGEKGERTTIDFADIQKAKLEFKYEKKTKSGDK